MNSTFFRTRSISLKVFMFMLNIVKILKIKSLLIFCNWLNHVVIFKFTILKWSMTKSFQLLLFQINQKILTLLFKMAKKEISTIVVTCLRKWGNKEFMCVTNICYSSIPSPSTSKTLRMSFEQFLNILLSS